MMNEVKDLLDEAALATGWDEDSQIHVLCDFLSELAESQRDLKESFRAYLVGRAEEEAASAELE